MSNNHPAEPHAHVYTARAPTRSLIHTRARAHKHTHNSLNLTTGDRALVINGAITIQSYVPQRQLTRSNDKNVVRSYQYAETVYLLLTINQTASLKVWAVLQSPIVS